MTEHENLFPPGTAIRVQQEICRRGEPTVVETVGVVDAWTLQPTGSWHAHGKNDKLWLHRLRLRKADGEIALLVLDDHTSIARIELTAKAR